MQSGREALRNTGQGVLLDAVTAYTNVLANQSLVEAQRINVTFLRETLATTKKRLEGGDVTPTDVAQAEARLSRGLADLNAAEVGLAISQALYAQVIGAPPGRLVPPASIDRLLPRTREEAIAIARKDASRHSGRDVRYRYGPVRHQDRREQPVAAASVQAGVSRNRNTDTTLGANGHRQRLDPGQANVPIYDGGLAASQIRQAKETGDAEPASCWSSSATQTQTAVVSAWVAYEGAKIALSAAESRRSAPPPSHSPGVQKEAQAGQRTTLDVLNSQQDLMACARAADRRATRPRDRRLCAARRRRPPRRQDARPQHAGLHARDALSPGPRCVARFAHAGGPVAVAAL